MAIFSDLVIMLVLYPLVKGGKIGIAQARFSRYSMM